MRTVSSRLPVDGKSLEIVEWKVRDARETILLIHEALGSASYWKTFPEQLAEATRSNVAAYSRAGHGESEGPLEPRSIRYYERQVEVVLPRLIEKLNIARPILYGHSEGAAIAFLYASTGRPVKAIIAESPIVAPDENTLRTVDGMDAAQPWSELIEKLRRYHRNPEAVFSSWVEGVRLHLARQFPTTSYLRQIHAPVLVIEGELDPFGGPAQRAVLQAELADLRLVVLAETGHLPHRERTQQLIEAVTRFLSDSFEPTGEVPVKQTRDPPQKQE